MLPHYLGCYLNFASLVIISVTDYKEYVSTHNYVGSADKNNSIDARGRATEYRPKRCVFRAQKGRGC